MRITFRPAILCLSLLFLYGFPVYPDKTFQHYFISMKGDIYYSSHNESMVEVNSGLMQKKVPIRFYGSPDRQLYLATLHSGLYLLDLNTTAWKNISPPDTRTRRTYKPSGPNRKISAFSVDVLDPAHMVCATKHSLYESNNRGITWTRVPMKGLGSINHITALALRGREIYAGTSFSGIFVRSHEKFVAINKGLPSEPYSGSVNFFDETTCLYIDKDSGQIFAGFASGRGIYYSNEHGTMWHRIDMPDRNDHFNQVDDISFHHGSIYLSCEGKIARMDWATKIWYDISIPHSELIPDKDMTAQYVIDPSDTYPTLFIRHSSYGALKQQVPLYNSGTGAGKKAIYANPNVIQKKSAELIEIIKACGLNAIVVDMKDDFGDIHFPVKISTALEINAAKKPLNLTPLLNTFKKNNIYVIARIVVFKDRNLYRAYGSRYAIKNRKTGKPWKGNPREYWVDPYSAFVQDYNIALARELDLLGFDEIQFDYIRFPSDGPVELCAFPFQKDPDTYKSEILADFLQKAKDSLSVPISTDIYGFNAWYRFGNSIGQDIEEFSLIADVICPMVYPSHFGTKFYMAGDRATRTYRLIHDGGIRALKITGPAVVRPYLQAFNLLSPAWGPDYIMDQVRGAEDSGSSGYTFWNASGNYKMVDKALNKKNSMNK